MKMIIPVDWENIQEDILCPLCGYNLRGLIEPRCPECGFRFEWPDLIDITRRLHPFVFEHHPKRNFWSFRKTVSGGLRPRQFWSSLHPVQPSSPKRLVLYWGFCASFILLGFASNLSALIVHWAQSNAARRQAWTAFFNSPAGAANKQETIKNFGSLQAYYDVTLPIDTMDLLRRWFREPESVRIFLLPVLILLGWPWVTLLTLLLFMFSMKRARVKPIHVMRCALYNSDVLIWLSFGLLLIPTTLLFGLFNFNPLFTTTVLSSALAGLVITILWYGFRLAVAYHRYLRFQQPYLVVMLSQLVVSLLTLIVILRTTVGS